jgi:hypothetical protein
VTGAGIGPWARERLSNFFAGYFHQDWEEILDDHWENVVARFIDAEGTQTSVALVADLRQLRTIVPEADLERVMFDELGGYFRPLDRSMAEWLDELVAEFGRLGVRAALH